MSHLVLRCSLVTAASLFGGMFAGVLLGLLIHGLPVGLPEAVRVVLATVPALAGTVGGGVVWGRALARLFPGLDSRRMAVAGAAGFGPVVIALAFGLGTFEPVAIAESARGGMPVHVAFTLFFVPAAFVVAAVGGLAVALGSRRYAQWARLSLVPGAASAVAFLAVNLFMDAIGWRVGAPGAAERATMITVTFLGALAAALAAGAMLGRLLRTPAAAATRAMQTA